MAPVNSVSGTCELLEVIFIQQPMKDVLLSWQASKTLQGPQQ